MSINTMATPPLRAFRIFAFPARLLRSATLTQRAVVYIAAGAAAIYGSVQGYRDYNAWLALGPGGLPPNVFGWAIQAAAGLVFPTNMISINCYDKALRMETYGAEGARSYIDGQSLPTRRGARPHVPGYLAPQRQSLDQRDELASGDLQEVSVLKN